MRTRRRLRKLQGLQLKRETDAFVESIRSAFAVPDLEVNVPAFDRGFWMRSLAEVLRLVAAALAGYGAGGVA